MPEEYETLMYRWFEEVWNQGREEAIDEMFAEDGIGYGLPTENGEPIRGPKDFRIFFRQFREAFPNIKVTVEDMVRDGDKIVARCSVRGSLEGESLRVSPAGQPVDFTGMVIARIENGKIAEAWNEWDFMTMYSQLGVLSLDLK